MPNLLELSLSILLLPFRPSSPPTQTNDIVKEKGQTLNSLAMACFHSYQGTETTLQLSVACITNSQVSVHIHRMELTIINYLSQWWTSGHVRVVNLHFSSWELWWLCRGCWSRLNSLVISLASASGKQYDMVACRSKARKKSTPIFLIGEESFADALEWYDNEGGLWDEVSWLELICLLAGTEWRALGFIFGCFFWFWFFCIRWVFKKYSLNF